VSIIQENQVEERSPGQFLETDGLAALEYPQSHREQRKRRIALPVFLWSGLLVAGILMLFARGPVNAPLFEQLTQYVCDPLPPLPNIGRQTYSLRLKCRAGDNVVYQRGYPTDGSNSNAFVACTRSGGIFRIWRYANPSPYGPYVFHSTCNDRVLMYYNYRAAAYESTQSFVIVVGWLLIGVGGIGLTSKLLARRKHVANTG
jgi:hypothetical protein